jgi:GNAT superfamily N-acetyltransferase
MLLSMLIRQATIADVPVLLKLIQALAEYEKLTDVCVGTEADLARQLFGDDPAAEAVIAEVEGASVGFALWFRNFSTFLAKPGLYLEDLFVLPEHRGAGVGKALLLHLVGIAKARGYGRMEWSVLDWNLPSIGFYKKMGALAMDEWTQFRLTEEKLAELCDVQ